VGRVAGKRFSASGKWDGPDDLSGKLRFGYDDANLCFAAEVTDNVHSERFDGRRFGRATASRLASTR